MSILTLDTITLRAPVGGKAHGLAQLIKSGFRVPQGFVILPEQALDEQEILAAFDRLKIPRAAVRSSAINEDGTKAAWAGQLETKLNVKREELLLAIETCRASARSDRAQAYAHVQGQQSGGVAVIVQRMLKSDISGVAFSKHPVTGEDAVVVEAVHGLGEQLVSGYVTPDTYVIGESFAISKQHLSTNKPILNTVQIEAVATLTRTIADQFGFPVDVEWAYESDTLYVLQARPITT